MMTLEARNDRAGDWLVANPWLWLPLGLLFSVAAFLWVRLYDDQAVWFRMVLIVAGILCASGAVTLRLNSPCRAFLDRVPPAARSMFVAVLFLANAALVLCALVFLGITLIQTGVQGNFGIVLFVNALVLPIAGSVAWLCLDRCKTNKSLGKAGEAAAILVLASVCAFLCSRALFLDQARADRWDTIRLFLGVLSGVTIVCAGLMLLPTRAQRIVVSVLILYHFGGILTAVMSAPPTPWIFRQVWARMYKPYLQFLFMNNAYHFYAPEPGPSCFVWFYIEYQNDAGEKKFLWDEFPKIRDDGIPDYPTALNYQRRLAMTDHIQHVELKQPPEWILNSKGQSIQNPIYYWRQVNSDHPPPDSLGKTSPTPILKVPFHPSIQPALQYRPPDAYSRGMVESFALHEFKSPPQQFPGYRVVSLKMYKVVHQVAPDVLIAAGIKPTDPILYQPYYMGQYGMKADKHGHKQFELLDRPEFDKDGNLKSGDPLLYWLLPILPASNNYDAAALAKQKIYGYVYQHAGDPKWVWYPDEMTPREP